MNDFHGIIFAYKAYPELRGLVQKRTSASLPVCGGYRLIDFALSSLRNAGITDVGVLMQRDYQSLLDHLSNGQPWDMAKRNGGLRLLPPFGLPQYHHGDYSGTIEALNTVSSYIHDIPQNHIVLMLGNLCGNIDLGEVCLQHLRSGAKITAILGNYQPDVPHHRCITDEYGNVRSFLFERVGCGEGLPSLEAYVIDKDLLLSLMDRCKAQNKIRFHKDALAMYLEEGGTISSYVHTSYARFIRTTEGYFAANMDILDPVNRSSLFPADRPVRGKPIDGVSTFYGTNARSVNSLVSDNCVIDGTVENCVIFPGVRIEKGAVLKNCILLKDSVIAEGARLEYIIADKDVRITRETSLVGNARLPILIPKGATV